jgi:hypothetical protein
LCLNFQINTKIGEQENKNLQEEKQENMAHDLNLIRKDNIQDKMDKKIKESYIWELKIKKDIERIYESRQATNLVE